MYFMLEADDETRVAIGNSKYLSPGVEEGQELA